MQKQHRNNMALHYLCQFISWLRQNYKKINKVLKTLIFLPNLEILVRLLTHPIGCSAQKCSVSIALSRPRGKMIFPQVSWWIRHSGPTQKRRHSSSGCRSSHPNWVTHQHPVSQQKQRRHARDCIVRVARKFLPKHFRLVSLCKVHSLAAVQTKKIGRRDTLKLTNELTFMLNFSSDPSFTTYASCPSTPSTWQKQFVVCPIPLGRILSFNMAFITELLPFDVRPKNATFM